jgi:hypothetical protein
MTVIQARQISLEYEADSSKEFLLSVNYTMPDV